MDGDLDQNHGIIPRTIEFLFAHFSMQKLFGWEYKLSISCLKIFNERLYDLINNDVELKAEQRENLMRKDISSCVDFTDWFQTLRVKKTSAQKIPSHYILQLWLSGSHAGGADKIQSKMDFIDAAGAEIETDLSLNELTKVINALSTPDAKNVNEAGSVLTKLLKPTLNENCNSILFFHLQTSDGTLDDSVNALRRIQDVI